MRGFGRGRRRVDSAFRQKLLLSLGFRVVGIRSAAAFLAIRQRENTGCLVLDLRMPEWYGLD